MEGMMKNLLWSGGIMRKDYSDKGRIHYVGLAAIKDFKICMESLLMSDKVVVETTVSTHGHTNSHNKRPAFIYPTVAPETVVIPIVSCIFGFPLLALLVICCLRRRAKLAREHARRRDIEHGRSTRAVSLRSERAMSRGFPSLELDTVLEERSDPEPEATVVELVTPDIDSDS